MANPARNLYVLRTISTESKAVEFVRYFETVMAALKILADFRKEARASLGFSICFFLYDSYVFRYLLVVVAVLVAAPNNPKNLYD